MTDVGVAGMVCMEVGFMQVNYRVNWLMSKHIYMLQSLPVLFQQFTKRCQIESILYLKRLETYIVNSINQPHRTTTIVAKITWNTTHL